MGNEAVCKVVCLRTGVQEKWSPCLEQKLFYDVFIGVMVLETCSKNTVPKIVLLLKQ